MLSLVRGTASISWATLAGTRESTGNVDELLPDRVSAATAAAVDWGTGVAVDCLVAVGAVVAV